MFKKKKIEIIDKWEDVTLEMFMKINEIGASNDEEDIKNLKVAALLSNKTLEELEEMPISKAIELISHTRFLFTPAPRVKSKRNLNLNGKEYRVMSKTEEMTTAQFIEFQSVAKNINEMLVEFISIFIIPKGHKYGDGYDMEEVYDDVKTMSVVEALGLADFFTDAYRKLLKHTLLFSEARMKTMAILGNKKQRELAREAHRILKQARANLTSLIG